MGFQSEAVDDDEEQGSQTGKGLRAQLEEALNERKALEVEVVTLKAGSILQAKGFDLVSVDDLKGVKPADLESKAAELQKERLETASKVLRQKFSNQGLTGDDLDQAVEDFFGPAVTADDDDDEDLAALSRARGIPAGEPSRIVNPDKLHGGDAIAYALEQNERKRAKRNS